MQLGLPAPVVFAGGYQRYQVGYPAGGYFDQKVITGYADANHDGIIEPGEIQIDSTRPHYLGSPLPTRNLGWNNEFTIARYFRLSTLIDYKGGFKQYNLTESFRCQSGVLICQGLFDPTASLDRQARSVAANLYNVQSAWIEDGDFVKLREVSLTATLPDAFARRVRARAMSLTFAGRNLYTWTKYSGVDPEVNSVGAPTGPGGNTGVNSFSQSDFLSQPQVRYLTVRLNVSY